MDRIELLPPGELWRDTNGSMIQAHGGGVFCFDGRYYWFGENRDTCIPGEKTKGVSCYSSSDLRTWHDHGVVLGADRLSDQDLSPQRVIERPKVLYNNHTQQFVMVLHIDSQNYREAKVGFAVASHPWGPYEYRGSVRPNGNESRDMTVFQDDNDVAYLFYASEGNSTMHVDMLSDDYLSFRGQSVRIFEGLSREAPAVFKRGSKYFLITSACTGWRPNAAMYAVADSPTGPWRTMGNPCLGEGADITFGTQSACVFSVLEPSGSYIFMADRWHPENLKDSRYIWLPIEFRDESSIIIRWPGVDSAQLSG